MKIVLAPLLGLVSQIKADGCIRGKRSVGDCGGTSYNQCNDQCCGGVLYSAQFGELPGAATTSRSCCGHHEVGGWYETGDTGTTRNLCCFPGYSYDDGTGATATHAVHVGVSHTTGCCADGTAAPVTFDGTEQMCCQGSLAHVGDTSFTSCCREVSYDRRLKSCPCGNGALSDTAEVSDTDVDYRYQGGCCYKTDAVTGVVTSTNYNQLTEFCCEGTVGTTGTDICCSGSLLGGGTADSDLRCCRSSTGTESSYDHNTHYCCCNEIRARTVDGRGAITEEGTHEECCETTCTAYRSDEDICCELETGRGDSCCNGRPYDSRFQLCCDDDTVTDRFTGADLTLTFDSCCGSTAMLGSSSVCCGGTVSDSAGGTLNSCCGSTPFDGGSHVCCGGGISGPFERPSCCGSTGFDGSAHVCCNGGIEGPFGSPSCCHETAYDSSSHSCCGSAISPNPVITDARGGTSTSSHASCCLVSDGAVTPAYSWVSYDYDSKHCCHSGSGSIGSVVDRSDDGECCGSSYIDHSTHKCCRHGLVSAGVSNPYGDAGICCGTDICDSRVEYCSEDTCHTPTTGPHEDRCCGTVYSTDTHMCCDCEVRDLGGVSRESAICCGDACVDGDTYWCCSGTLYAKGESVGVTMPHSDCCTSDDCNTCVCTWTEWSACSSRSCGDPGTRTRDRAACLDRASAVCTGGDGEGETETDDCDGC